MVSLWQFQSFIWCEILIGLHENGKLDVGYFSNHIELNFEMEDCIIKGALDNFSLIPNFFFKKVEIFISLEVYTYVVTAC